MGPFKTMRRATQKAACAGVKRRHVRCGARVTGADADSLRLRLRTATPPFRSMRIAAKALQVQRSGVAVFRRTHVGQEIGTDCRCRKISLCCMPETKGRIFSIKKTVVHLN